MEKIKELKVYRIVDAEYDGCQSGSNTVYICRGWACVSFLSIAVTKDLGN